MVNNWNPWGQPGNGAPNMDTRIRNLEMDGLYPVNKNVHGNSSLFMMLFRFLRATMVMKY